MYVCIIAKMYIEKSHHAGFTFYIKCIELLSTIIVFFADFHRLIVQKCSYKIYFEMFIKLIEQLFFSVFLLSF